MILARFLRAAALAAAGAVLGACQSVNTVSDGADSSLMLKGHDPVAYFTQGRHTPGSPAIKAEHDGVTYRFASPAHRALLEREPAKYVPQFGGFCANGIAYAIPWGGDPDTWSIIDGKLYIFGGQSSKNYFLMDEKRNLELAHRYWKEEVSGMPPRVHTAKRLVFKVPHYKTGRELEAEWQARKGK